MQEETPEPRWSVYMVRCRNGALYTGIAIDVAKRFTEHQQQGARCAKYLRGKGPLTLVYCATIGSRSAASQREYALKQLKKEAKERLIIEYSTNASCSLTPS